MSNMSNSPQSSSNVGLTDVSITGNQQPPTPIQVIMSGNTPLFIPRIQSNSNLAAMTDGFSLTADEQSQLNATKYANHSFSQLLSNSHLHDRLASEIDYSTYIGKQKHLFAHTPGTTYYHSQSLFNISYKKLLSLLTFLFTLHWFNHGIFHNILSTSSSSNYNSTQSALILSCSLIAIVIFAPIVGYIARRHPPLKILWIGFSIILLSTFITAFAGNFSSMLFARCLMGIGDATIIPIAAPLVLYTAPPDKKSLCLSIFLASIPLGYSFGYFVSSELLYNLPNELKIIDESWQRLFCWETVCLIPIVVYAWWRIEGPDSFIAMANYNVKTHNLYDIITNQLYLGIVFGHSLQGFGCCILTIIVWNKLNTSHFLGNGKGFALDAYELWSLSIFIFGTLGILMGGFLVDYVHNKSVFSAKKKKKKTSKAKRKDTPETTDHDIDHKPSLAETPSKEEYGDDANSHSLGSGMMQQNNPKSDTLPVNMPNNAAATPAGYISKSLDLSPHTTSQNMSGNTNNTSRKWSLNSENEHDPNRKESIEQYKLRKFVEQQAKKIQHSLSHIPPPEIPGEVTAQRQSLAALKKEQEERKDRRKKRRQRRKRRKKREAKKRFKPTTNLHTIRICFYKVVIPTSLICLLCIILLYFFNNNLWAFGFLGLMAQILTFIQVSALYTSMLWSIGIEWQCFGCGLAEIGFHLAGDGISPGLISSVLLGHGFKFELLMLIVVMMVSILIFFVTWKFVDFQIWNITQNSKNSKMFGLMCDESTYTSSITSSTITGTINNDDKYQSYKDLSSSDLDEDEYNNDHYGDDEDSSESGTNDMSESDWNPGVNAIF